ncbi:MAG: hypothetical protein AAFM92_07980 [Pseudomonadota bacterium]
MFSELKWIALAATLALAGAHAPQKVAAQQWAQERMNWKVSCSVDRGAYRKSGDTHLFTPSANRCTGGTYQQRTELTGKTIRVNRPATYLFETNISIQSDVALRNQDTGLFAVFQVHSDQSRDGCAPPMSLIWNGRNQLEIFSDYSRTGGSNFCEENTALTRARHTGPTLQRGGTVQNLRVLLEFDGSGGFDMTAFVDGKRAITGSYTPNRAAGYVPLESVYMKHGVYSPERWPYEMRSKGLRVLRARN